MLHLLNNRYRCFRPPSLQRPYYDVILIVYAVAGHRHLELVRISDTFRGKLKERVRTSQLKQLFQQS